VYGLATQNGVLYVSVSTGSAVFRIAGDTVGTVGSGFLKPEGIAVDDKGRVYVADTGHNAIKRVSPDGSIRTIGSHFHQPGGVAVDGKGDVYVADTGDGSAVRVAPNGAMTRIFGPTVEGVFSVACDQNGSVYIGQLTNVAKIAPDGHVTNFEAETLNTITGIAVAKKGQVYVASYWFPAVARLTGGNVLYVPVHFGQPSAVAWSEDGNLYVADNSRGTVQELSF
jgi:sugar lactone lactonase YvrE